MSTQPRTPTLRESVDELGDRLARIGASGVTLRNLAMEIRQGIAPSTLLTLIEQLARDLTLASREVGAVHERAALELASLRDGPRSP